MLKFNQAIITNTLDSKINLNTSNVKVQRLILK